MLELDEFGVSADAFRQLRHLDIVVMDESFSGEEMKEQLMATLYLPELSKLKTLRVFGDLPAPYAWQDTKKTWRPVEKMCIKKGISCEISYPLVRTMTSAGDDNDEDEVLT